MTQNTEGKFVIPGGLKIFWGRAQCSGTADPAGVYAVQITFPEPFSNDKYAFVPVRFNYSADQNKGSSAFGYYQKMKNYVLVGNDFGPITFEWIAIGY